MTEQAKPTGKGGTMPWIMLLALVAAGQAAPVIDDVALERGFVAGLARPEADALHGKRATKALEAAEGKTVDFPAVAAPVPPDYESVCRGVVVIGSVDFCPDCQETHTGAVSSGWIASSEGHVVTNHHVLADKTAGELGVMTFDGTVYPVLEVLAADREGDAAILRIDPGGAALSALPLSAGVRTGNNIRVVGHPDGRFYSLTEGIVSRVFVEPTSDERGTRTWLTVTADYGGGSSGAPVLNEAGEVVGMVSSTAALLADAVEGAESGAADVQMVFRDCASVETIGGLFRRRE
jgi:S1-C subfamily serine protease